MTVVRWKALERRVVQHSPWRRIEDVTFELPDGQVRTFSLKKKGESSASSRSPARRG